MCFADRDLCGAANLFPGRGGVGDALVADQTYGKDRADPGAPYVIDVLNQVNAPPAARVQVSRPTAERRGGIASARQTVS